MASNPYSQLTGAGDHDWWVDAACRVESSEAFFPESRAGRPLSLRSELHAKAICARCPVQPQCLSAALRNQEPTGIWGGTTPAERTEILARQHRVVVTAS